MIKIEVTRKNGNVKQVCFKGHALYDEYGKDIVCSAVSSIVITTINAILSINDKAISYSENPLLIEVLNNDEIKFIGNAIKEKKGLLDIFKK